MDDNFQRYIEETELVDEGQVGLVSSIVATLLAVQNYVTAQDIQQRLPRNATADQVQAAVTAAAAERDKGGWRNDARGYTAIQAINVVARTLFWETRGETDLGRKLVATVIWNRAGQDSTKVSDVCLKRKQFSCWNKAHSDASYLDPKTFKVKVPGPATKNAQEARVWDDCKSLAQKLVSGGFVPEEGNYNAYYNPKLASSASQSWISKLTGKTEEGNHVFGYLADQDPKAKAQGKTQAAAETAKTYKVKRGDTLTNIARRLIDDGSCPSFKDTKSLVAAIISTNKLRNNGNSIQVGQVLNIPTRG